MEKKEQLTALIEGFNKKASNVESKIQELQAERQRLTVEVSEADANYRNVVTQVTLGTQGYYNKNLTESKRRLETLKAELKDVVDTIDTLEAAKHTELAKFVPDIEQAFQQYAAAYNAAVVAPLHDGIHAAKVQYLAAIAKVKEMETEPSSLLQEVQNVRYRAGVRDEKRNLRYSAPQMNTGARASLGENDQTTRIEPSEINDVLTGKVAVLPRVQCLVKHGKLFLKTADAQAFLKNPVVEGAIE